ncbi:MAG: DegT/DnrJ/EryC1/StrS family aminotransferase [Thermoanaerobaculia bacterium]
MAQQPVPPLDLTRYDAALQSDIARAVSAVFETGRFVMGPAVEDFERAFAAALGVRHAIGVSSGTDALLVSLMALDLRPGDEVITTPFTFFASAGEVARLNARPVFVDIEPSTFNMDPAKLEEAVTPRTRAIQPVHLYGQTADMDPILATAAGRGIPVLEDACQAVGATYRARPAGGLGTLAAFSFYPTKNLAAAGDAGAVTTGDDTLARKIRALRIHGGMRQYHHELVGGNFRIDALQAAVLHAKLPRLAGWTERRREVARLYDGLLGDAEREGLLTLPAEAPGRRHVYHQYVVRVPGRDRVRARLAEEGIATSVFYPIPLHRQECFRDLGLAEGAFPESERAAREVLALPIFAEIRDDEVERVAAALIRVLGERYSK